MMGLSVLHPGLLIAGVLCVSIPILVHLLRRKHRPISWGAMRFLEQAYKKRRRLITLEQLLLLLTRCAIMLCIAGAVGALVFGSGSFDQRGRTLVLVIDNSIHSATKLESGLESIEYQKQRALELLQTLDPINGDRVALITAAAPARADALPATSELGLIRSRIESIEPTDAERDLGGAFSLIESSLSDDIESSTTHAAMMLSPYGWSNETAPQDLTTSKLESIFIDEPSGSRSQNVAIRSIAPLRPMMTLTSQENASLSDAIQGVRIELSRSDASNDQRSRVELTDPSSGEQLAAQDVQWRSGQRAQLLTIPLRPNQISRSRGNWAVVRAALLEDDANPRDNTRTTGFPVHSEMRIGIIDSFNNSTESSSIQSSRWVRAALGADEGVISIQMIEARIAEDRIDPSLDALFILAPASLSDRGWSRVSSLHAAGMPVVVTADAHSLSLEWIDRLTELSPGLLHDEVRIQVFDSPRGLANTLSPDTSEPSPYLQGIESEYPRLASSVQIHRALFIESGPGARVMLMDSEQHPIALSTLSDEQAVPLVLFGFAFDVQWTDLQARPIFVALMHELTRMMISQSQSPRVLIAGVESEFGSTLEQLVGGIAQVDPRVAGTYVQVDELGSGQRGVLINPDTRFTTISSDESLGAPQALAGQFGELPIQDLSTIATLGRGVFPEQSNEGGSISLILFAIAAALGVLDFILARRCSYKAVHAGNQGVAI